VAAGGRNWESIKALPGGRFSLSCQRTPAPVTFRRSASGWGLGGLVHLASAIRQVPYRAFTGIGETVSPSTSTNLDVEGLLSLNNARLQVLVLKAFKRSGKRSMARSTILEEIARAEGVTQLRGSKRAQFQISVNNAIGALIRKSPPKLVKRGAENKMVALPNASKNTTPETRLLTAVRDRIVSLRFTCVRCGLVNEITDLSEEGWCEREGCLTSFYDRS
jgi:hypothetical protein